MFGWTAEEAVGQTPEGLGCIHPEDLTFVRHTWAQAKTHPRQQRMRLRTRNFRKDGTFIWCEVFGSIVPNPAKAGTPQSHSVVCFGVDITARVEARRVLTRAAQRDNLTQLLNRHAFYEALTHDLTSNHGRAAVLFVDLDGFKEV